MQEPADTRQYAGFWIRLLASLLDTIIVSVPLYFIVGLFFGFDWGLNDKLWTLSGIRANSLDALLDAAVVILLWVHWRGRTPGKKLLGIRIVRYHQSQPLSYRNAILRYVGYLASILVLAMGFIMIAARKDKRGLHDLIGGTCVIRDERQ